MGKQAQEMRAFSYKVIVAVFILPNQSLTNRYLLPLPRTNIDELILDKFYHR